MNNLLNKAIASWRPNTADGAASGVEGSCGLLGEAGWPCLRGKQMTLFVRACARDGAWSGTLLARADEAPHARLLYCAPINPRHIGSRERARMSDDTAIEYLWQTDPLKKRVVPEYFSDNSPFDWQVSRKHPDCLEGLMRLAAPVDLIGREGWRDIVIRFNHATLSMFVDGALVDEEWPHGELRGFDGPFVIGGEMKGGAPSQDFSGQIGLVAIWDRALSDEEIAFLSGGTEKARRRRREIEGPPPASLQYWRPPGYNQFVGDCMPFYHEGVLHFFYLKDRRHHQSKWGCGAHAFGHASTRDLVHWTHHPDALTIDHQNELSLGTGNCYFHNGVFYLYWIAHNRRLPFTDAAAHQDDIFVATSSDGVRFTKQSEPWVRLNYRTGGDINPFVLHDAASGRHVMVIGGDEKHLDGIERFESQDLKTWRPSQALGSVGKLGVCPSYLEWNGWRYIASWRRTPLTYWMSDAPLNEDRFCPGPEGLADTVAVPMIAPFSDNRALLVGFRCYQNGYASQAVFRELAQQPDGTLRVKWVEEMIPPSGPPLALPVATLHGRVSRHGDSVQVTAVDGCAAAAIEDLPRDCRVTMRVIPGRGSSAFGLRLRADKTSASGYELRFVPERHSLEMRSAPGAEPRKSGTFNGEPEVIDRLDQPFNLDLIIKEDFFDLNLDDRVTKIHPLLCDGTALCLFVERGEVTFEIVAIRPLTGETK